MMKLIVAFCNFANAHQNGWRKIQKKCVNGIKLAETSVIACLFNHFHEAKCSAAAENFFST
jgi:hypothetical protein